MSQKPLYARIDLHCHSWASDKPTLWFMQRLGCPESFTNPEHLREIAQMRGMNFVTITDHDTIDGVRAIQQYENVITGCEVTARFPGDVKVHVVCLDLTEAQFEEINQLRHNIFDFVDDQLAKIPFQWHHHTGHECTEECVNTDNLASSAKHK